MPRSRPTNPRRRNRAERCGQDAARDANSLPKNNGKTGNQSVDAKSDIFLTDSGPSDVVLAALIEAWATLPENIKEAIATMVMAAKHGAALPSKVALHLLDNLAESDSQRG